MGKRIGFLAAAFFLSQNIRSTLFSDYPLLLAPHDQVPYHAVGAIVKAEGHNFNIVCTGVLLSPTVVLTAANCLYDINVSNWKEKQFFLPVTFAVPGNRSLGVKRYIVPKEYIEFDQAGKGASIKQKNFDFGAIILDRELDEGISSIFSIDSRDPLYVSHIPQFPPSPTKPIQEIPPLANLPRESDDLRMLAGFPQARGFEPGKLYTTFCPIRPFLQKDDGGLDRVFYGYKCSAIYGMSGSPIFYKEDDGHYKVLGINITEAPTYNIGVHINYKKSLRIKYWIQNKQADPQLDRFTNL